MHANQCQVTLGDACMEITREPVADNASELLPKFHVSGVSPTPFREKPAPPNDQYWVYRWDTVTVIRIYVSDGRHIDLELQEITNQPTWSSGTEFGIQTAVSDINAWLVGAPPIPIPNPIPIGGIIDDDNDPLNEGLTVFNPANWTYLGSSGTATVNASDITFNGGDSSPNNYLYYSNLETNLHSCVYTVRFIGSNTDVFGVGFGPLDGTTAFNSAIIDLRGLTDFFNIVTGALGTDVYPSGMPFANGDHIELKITKTLLSLKLEVKNITQGSPYITINQSYSITDGVSPNIFGAHRLILFNVNTTNMKVTHFKYESLEYRYPDYLFVGDSRIQGCYVNNESDLVTNLYATATGKKVTSLASRGEKMAGQVRLNKLISILAPRYLVLMAPVLNDFFAFSYGPTTEAQYDSMVANVLAIPGRTVYHHKAILTSDGTNQSAFDTFLDNNYPTQQIPAIPIGTGYLTPDNIHWLLPYSSDESDNLQSFLP